jgi:hypothetical protein
MLLKILKAEKPGFPMVLTTDRDGTCLRLDLRILDAKVDYREEPCSNDPSSFQGDQAKDAQFVTFIHFFVISTIARHYAGSFLISRDDACCNGFQVRLACETPQKKSAPA